MTRRSVVALIFLLSCVYLPACSSWIHRAEDLPATAKKFHLLWQDDFKTEKTLDQKKWFVHLEKRGDSEQNLESMRLEDGVLKFRNYSENGIFHSGFITTENSFYTTHGYFEAKIRFHEQPGSWCAFWLFPDKIGLPQNPKEGGVETDIVEHRAVDAAGHYIANQIGINLHWDGYGKEHEWVGTTVENSTCQDSFDNIWHIYSVLWEPELYVFYIDGIERWRITHAVSERPEQVRLTCEIKDKDWAGRIPAGGYADLKHSDNGMDVEWIRVWKRDEIEQK